MCVSGETADAIVAAHGLGQISDDAALAEIVRQVIAANPTPVGQYRAGKAKTFGFLVGQAMKATGGRGNPEVVSGLLRRALEPGWTS